MRSFLFVPADSSASSPRARVRPDGLILDLEDSVAADRKKIARDMALAYLSAPTAPAPSSMCASTRSIPA